MEKWQLGYFMNKLMKKAEIYEQCVACGCCAKICPINVISVYKGIRAIVDGEKCIGCGKCANTCPALVIHIVEREVGRNETEALV